MKETFLKICQYSDLSDYFGPHVPAASNAGRVKRSGTPHQHSQQKGGVNVLYGQSALATGGYLIRDHGSRLTPAPHQPASSSQALSFLEEEIHRLRIRMEKLFEQEQSLTSPHVVEASNELDLKINEYIRYHEFQEKPGSR